MWESVSSSDKVLIYLRALEKSGLDGVVSPNLPPVYFPSCGTFRHLAPLPKFCWRSLSAPSRQLGRHRTPYKGMHASRGTPHKAMFASRSSKQTWPTPTWPLKLMANRERSPPSLYLKFKQDLCACFLEWRILYLELQLSLEIGFIKDWGRVLPNKPLTSSWSRPQT